MFVVVAKTIITLICTSLTGVMIVYRGPIMKCLGHYNEDLVGVIAWVLARLLPFVVIFVMLDFTPFSDLDGFFGQAREAVQLKMVYRDFSCMYSPLFPYFNALALWFWMDKKAIIVGMILMEGIALWATNSFYEQSLSKTERLYRSLIYLLLPGSLVLCVLGGQEDVWLWLMLICAYLIWQRTQQVVWFGVALVIGFLFTKAVFILIGPALLLLVPKPMKWLTAAALIGVLFLGVLYYYTEWLWLEQPLHEAATLRAPNLLSVLNPLCFDTLKAGHKVWNWVGLTSTVGVGTWMAFRVRRLPFVRAFSAVFFVIYATMMLLQQSAYSNYIFIFLLPLTFLWVDFQNRSQVAWLLSFNAFAVIHPSLWWRLQSPYYRSPAAIFAQPIYVLDYALQVGVVICTFYFLRLVWQKALEF
ncbi:MAG: hypothetical protein R2822_22275 [Spirosomataceae bacterium]